MKFLRRAPGKPGQLGILSAAFNPPTLAHLALARAGLKVLDEVLFVLPGVFPHRKTYKTIGLAERVRMLEAALEDELRFSIAVSEGGLFIEIARECRSVYGPETRLLFLCGRDAAERIIEWDYGRPGAILEMLEEFELLVAPRNGRYEPPPEVRARVHTLDLAGEYDHVSGTEVRERIARGQPWEHLVPELAVPLVREFYGAGET